MGKEIERIVNADRVEDLIAVFGSFDENIKRIEEALNVHVVNRGTELRVCGEEEMADKAVRTLEGLLSLAAKGELIDEQRVRYLITLVSEGNDHQVSQIAKDVVCITAKGKPIKAKTVGQQHYIKAIMKNTITIGVGPAGTGKTYLAVAAAVAAFNSVLPGTLGGTIIQISLVFFALSTILGWSYYGERCWGYLTNNNRLFDWIYKVIFICVCVIGAMGSGTLMWDISDTLNGMMAIPNLIALLFLSGVVVNITKDYFKDKK